MDERSLLDFIQRIVRSAPSQPQAQAMLMQLRQMITDTARPYPEDADYLKFLDIALGAVGELQALTNGDKALSAEDMAVAKRRADERREREASYRGRC